MKRINFIIVATLLFGVVAAFTSCKKYEEGPLLSLKSKNGRIFGTTNPLLPNDELILKKNYSIKEWSTYLIDLRKSKTELYENIHIHSGRKNIERAIRRGVEVEEINENSLKDIK